MGIIRFIIEVEDVDAPDFSITDSESDELLATMENEASKLGYSIYDSRIEREEV